jgi:hypothetical protein
MAFSNTDLVVMLTANSCDMGNRRRRMEWQMVTGSNAPDLPGAGTMTFGPVKEVE